MASIPCTFQLSARASSASAAAAARRVAAGGGEAGVAAAVAAERGGAGEREREGGADVLLQVREQGRRGRRHLRQPGQGRLRPRRRRAGEPASRSSSSPCCLRCSLIAPVHGECADE